MSGTCMNCGIIETAKGEILYKHDWIGDLKHSKHAKKLENFFRRYSWEEQRSVYSTGIVEVSKENDFDVLLCSDCCLSCLKCERSIVTFDASLFYKGYNPVMDRACIVWEDKAFYTQDDDYHHDPYCMDCLYETEYEEMIEYIGDEIKSYSSETFDLLLDQENEVAEKVYNRIISRLTENARSSDDIDYTDLTDVIREELYEKGFLEETETEAYKNDESFFAHVCKEHNWIELYSGDNIDFLCPICETILFAKEKNYEVG